MDSIFIPIPSVRPRVMETTWRWYVHAFEAKANPDLLSELEARAKEKGVGPRVKDALENLHRVLGNRKMFQDTALPYDIHFVISDNSAYRSEKSVKETHTPDALRLVKILNSIGNKYGVYTHYITRDEMEQERPALDALKDGKHPQFVLNKNWRVKMSPGAARNFALSYISAFHTKYRGNSSKEYFITMDDDTYPHTGFVKWAENPRIRRNFFVDLKQSLDGNSELGNYGDYMGYDATRDERRGLGIHPSNFFAYKIHPSRNTYFSTAKNEVRGYKYPTTELFLTPSYLFHNEKASTWFSKQRQKETATFGTYPGGGVVEPINRSTVAVVLSSSGIRLNRKNKNISK